MKTFLAILAVLVVATTAPLQARDHHGRDRHDHRHHSEHRHGGHHHGYSRGHHLDHHHGHGHSPHYPSRGASYRCDGGFMVWMPGLGYVFRSIHQHHRPYCD